MTDLAGHEKYLKTTLYGLTSGAPSCVILIVGANAGLIGMSKEHLAIALALSVPVVVCITKVRTIIAASNKNVTDGPLGRYDASKCISRDHQAGRQDLEEPWVQKDPRVRQVRRDCSRDRHLIRI
jgi:selenocysteine-specific translation elongation factor